MAEVSEAQRKTRRRAVGRRLISKGSELSVLRAAILAGGNDLDFLTDAERKRLDKLLDQLRVVGKHLDAMGTKMDEAS